MRLPFLSNTFRSLQKMTFQSLLFNGGSERIGILSHLLSEAQKQRPKGLSFCSWRKREDSIRRTNPNTCTIFEQMAEARGFEPPRRLTRPHDFESCAFNHSATLPQLFYHIFTIITTQTRKICYNINVTSTGDAHLISRWMSR